VDYLKNLMILKCWLFLLGLLTGFSANAMPLEILSPDGRHVGILLGVVHVPAPYTASYIENIKKVADTASDLFVEADKRRLPSRDVLHKFYGLEKDSVRTLAEKHDKPCLRVLISEWDKVKYSKRYLLDWPVQGFFAAAMNGPIVKRIVKNSALPDMVPIEPLIAAIFERKNLGIQEVEGWEHSVGMARDWPLDLTLDTVEVTCRKMYGFKDGRFADDLNALNAYPSTDFLQSVALTMDGQYDLAREQDKQKFLETGQDKLFWISTFPKRDEYQARKIVSVLKSGFYKNPMFVLGMLHLGGNDGVISLLKREGYKFQPAQLK
jgi:TraB/PrgY/gumN family